MKSSATIGVFMFVRRASACGGRIKDSSTHHGLRTNIIAYTMGYYEGHECDHNVGTEALRDQPLTSSICANFNWLNSGTPVFPKTLPIGLSGSGKSSTSIPLLGGRSHQDNSENFGGDNTVRVSP